MTPTLLGRWQTRSFLLVVFGIPITWAFGLRYGDQKAVWLVLSCVLGFGYLWDIAYHHLQQYRWDHDWPAFFQWLAALWEGVFLWTLLGVTPLGTHWGIHINPPDGHGLTLERFVFHYGTVWIVIFLASQTLMRIWFPRWRYNGGRWWG